MTSRDRSGPLGGTPFQADHSVLQPHRCGDRQHSDEKAPTELADGYQPARPGTPEEVGLDVTATAWHPWQVLRGFHLERRFI
jgi:hypothetical protein